MKATNLTIEDGRIPSGITFKNLANNTWFIWGENVHIPGMCIKIKDGFVELEAGSYTYPADVSDLLMTMPVTPYDDVLVTIKG